ncbi:MAG TPA: cyclomaltodextrin glucanotransferase, partial [Lysobacter sp.]
LNKGQSPATFEVKQWLQPGRWRAAVAGTDIEIGEGQALETSVPGHGVEVYLLDAPVTRTDLHQQLSKAMQTSRKR